MNRNKFIKLIGLSPLMIDMENLNDLKKYSDEFSDTDKMPALFLGHGSPMNAIDDNSFVKGFRDIAQTLPKPKAILCISAHWFIRGTKVLAMETPKTIHDFSGFPKELYEIQYPAKGSPALALKTKKLLSPTNVELDYDWGLDHGTWSVVKHLYPKAEIPIIQMSIDYTQPAQYHFDLANKLKGLRNKGILIIGSGNIIHNLGLIDYQNIDKENYGYDWAIEARESINNYLLSGNYRPLIEYTKQNKAFQLAIPSPDHYLPLIYALGLKDTSDSLSLFNDKLLAGSISMTSLKITE